MNQFAGTTRSSGSKRIFFDQQHRETARGGSLRHTDAVDAATNNHNIVVRADHCRVLLVRADVSSSPISNVEMKSTPRSASAIACGRSLTP